jgi:hypothetical protein
MSFKKQIQKKTDSAILCQSQSLTQSLLNLAPTNNYDLARIRATNLSFSKPTPYPMDHRYMHDERASIMNQLDSSYIGF